MSVEPHQAFPSKWVGVNATVPAYTPPPAGQVFPSKWATTNATVPARRPVDFWTIIDGLRVPLWFRDQLTAEQQRSMLQWGAFFPDDGTAGLGKTVGVYDEDVLEEVHGPVIFTLPGLVIRDKWFRGQVRIMAPNIKFRNCRATGPTDEPATDAIIVATHASAANIVFEDCDMYPELPSHVTNVIIGHHFTLRRCNAYHGVDIVGVIGQLSDDRVDIVIEGSWLHDLVMFNTPTQSDNVTHNDVVQWHGLLGVKILGSRLEGMCAPGIGVVDTPPVWDGSRLVSGNPHYPGRWGFSCLMGSPARKLMGDLEVRKSWLNGGACGLNLSGPAIEMFPNVGVIEGTRFGYDWRVGADFAVLAKAAQVIDMHDNCRWNPADPWDDSIPFNVRKNG